MTELTKFKRRLELRIQELEATQRSLRAKLAKVEEMEHMLRRDEDLGQIVEEVERLDDQEEEKGQRFEKATQEKAVLELLSEYRQPLHPKEVAEMLLDQGYPFRSQKPENPIAVLLNQLTKDGKVRKVKTKQGIFFAINENTEEGFLTDEEIPF